VIDGKDDGDGCGVGVHGNGKKHKTKTNKKNEVTRTGGTRAWTANRYINTYFNVYILLI